MKLGILVLSLLMMSVTNTASGGAPTCHASSGGYCTYGGKVDRIYVNAGNLILLYFDTAASLDVPASVGYNVTNGAAAAFRIDSNPEFANYFYSTALAAQASGRDVYIQMRGVESGYLKFDRIWLSAP